MLSHFRWDKNCHCFPGQKLGWWPGTDENICCLKTDKGWVCFCLKMLQQSLPIVLTVKIHQAGNYIKGQLIKDREISVAFI
jgi:hypothetical protein